MAERDVYLVGGSKMTQKLQSHWLHRVDYSVVQADEFGEPPLSGFEEAMKKGVQMAVVNLLRDKRVKGGLNGREVVARLREKEGLIIVSFNVEPTGIPRANEHVRQTPDIKSFQELARKISSVIPNTEIADIASDRL